MKIRNNKSAGSMARELFARGWPVLVWANLALFAGISAARASEPVSAAAVDGAQPAPRVRISRDFFQNPYVVNVKVRTGEENAAGARETELETAGAWIEYPTELPAPAPDESTGPVLADFRDFKGCAELEEPGQVRLCFNVMPDVSNLGVNARESSLEGADQVVPSHCTMRDATLAFSRANREENGFTVEFASNGDQDPSCRTVVSLAFRQQAV